MRREARGERGEGPDNGVARDLSRNGVVRDLSRNGVARDLSRNGVVRDLSRIGGELRGEMREVRGCR